MPDVRRLVPVLALSAVLFGCGTPTPSTDLRSVLRATPEAAAFLGLLEALDVDVLSADVLASERLAGADVVTLFVPDEAMLNAYVRHRLWGYTGTPGDYTIDDLLTFLEGNGDDLIPAAWRNGLAAHAFAQLVSAADLIEIVDETWTVYDEATDSAVRKFPGETTFSLITGGSEGLSLTAYPVRLVEGEIAFDGGILHVVTVDDPEYVDDY